jgi:hypothetical protein
VSLVGVISATLAEKQLGLDAGPIVIDEVAGMIVTYLLVPMPEALLPRLAVLGAVFEAFRVFDIFKPWPVDRIQNLPGGMASWRTTCWPASTRPWPCGSAWRSFFPTSPDCTSPPRGGEAMSAFEIIAVGNELLSGDTLDTNFRALAQRLKELGVEVRRHVTVSDQETEIVAALRDSFTRVDRWW